MNQKSRTAACILILALSWTMVASAAKPQENPVVPDLTKGGEIDHSHQWTLGSTGARGWVYKYRNSTEMSRQIYVTRVDKGSPADGVLKVGDVILGVGGKNFDSDPRRAFAAAITEAEKKENGGKLNLIRWRDGKQAPVTVKLKVMGTFAATAPYDCEKSTKIVEMAVAALKKDGLDNGDPNPIDGAGIAGLFNALGLMATGRPDVMPMAEARMKQIAQEPVDGMKWGHAWSLIALAEYYLLTNDKDVLPAIERYATETAKGQSIAGTWGHGFAAADGVLGGYGAMNQVSLPHTIGMILAGKCGVDSPVVKQATAHSIRFFDYYVGKGSVPYGAHEAGDRFGPDDNGKSSAAAITFNLYGHKEGTEFFARHGLYDFSRIELGHASNFFHLPWQGLASAHLGPEAAAAHLRECRWYYELLRDWRGKWRHHEDANHLEVDKYWDATGARLLFFCLPRKKIHLTGKGGYLADPLSGKEVEKVVESGRYDGQYDALPTEELWTRLGDWCHSTRYRAAEELVNRKGDLCARAVKLYTGGSMDQKYGAARLLQALKEKAAPAVDHLVKNVEHPDIWLRIRTANVLGAIGQPARKAAPALLAAVSLEDPDDPRNMYRRTLSMVLFNNKGGLLADKAAMAAIPKEKLIAALRILLRTEEGQSVTTLQYPLQQLSFEDLESLWPEITYRIEHRLSENVMFANMQAACLDIMAEHKVEEGLRLSAYFLNTQNGWGADRRNKLILASLGKYGKHATQAFFPLETYLEKNPGLSDEVQTFKQEVEQSKESPELVSIKPWLGDYQIGSHYEMLVTMRTLRKMIATKDLAEYWKTYELLQGLLERRPDWLAQTQSVMNELMAIPEAADIVEAHQAIQAIKQDVMDNKIEYEQAIKKFESYRDQYDIAVRGPNLVYWYSLMWSDTLKAGKKLK